MKKEKIKDLIKQFSKIFKIFPITLITIIFLTIFYTICIDTNIFSDETIQNISIFCICFGVSSFFIENAFDSKSKKFKIIVFIIDAVFSILITLGFNFKNDFYGISNNILIEYLARFFISYLICIFIYTINIIYRKKDYKFNEYLVRVSVNAFKNSILYGILSTGVLLICLAIISLLIENDSYTLIARVQILLLGIFYIPTLLYSLTGEEKEIGKFAKIIIKNILETLVFIAFLIIYAYIIKLIITWALPSNQIFRISAGLFILGCPIWTIASYYNDEKDIYYKINNLMPFAFIPFIGLQIYSIFVRISSYGFTPLRYLCVMLVILEILYLIIYFKNRVKIEKVLYVITFLVLISAVVPYINMFKISQISQYKNLKLIKQKTDLSEEEKSKIQSAYNYLISSTGGEKIVTNLLTDEEKDKILKFNPYNNVIMDNTNYIYGSKYLMGINISGYNSLYVFNRSDYSARLSLDFFKNLNFYTNDNKDITIDISSLLNDYIDNSIYFQDYFEKHNEYIIDNNTKLIIENISIDYYKDTKEIYSYSIHGYILVK